MRTAIWIGGLLSTIGLLGCGGGGSSSSGPTAEPSAPSTSPFAIVEPFVSAQDVGDIREAFSASSNAPWGFAHDGVDFFPAADLMPVQAAAAGRVEFVNQMANNVTGNWQVNVRVRYDATDAVEYVFEPFSRSEEAAQAQRSQIAVQSGQQLSARQLVGRIVIRGEGAHLHFGIAHGAGFVCPEPFFTPDARTAVLAVLRTRHPGWNLCY